jgi:hypothetical protein
MRPLAKGHWFHWTKGFAEQSKPTIWRSNHNSLVPQLPYGVDFTNPLTCRGHENVLSGQFQQAVFDRADKHSSI